MEGSLDADVDLGAEVDADAEGDAVPSNFGTLPGRSDSEGRSVVGEHVEDEVVDADCAAAWCTKGRLRVEWDDGRDGEARGDSR